MPGSHDLQSSYRQASIKTAGGLRAMATATQMQQLSQPSLPEIDHLVDESARVVPAGNGPSKILSGLAKIRGRQIAFTDSRKHIDMLFRGMRQTLDEAVVG